MPQRPPEPLGPALASSPKPAARPPGLPQLVGSNCSLCSRQPGPGGSPRSHLPLQGHSLGWPPTPQPARPKTNARGRKAMSKHGCELEGTPEQFQIGLQRSRANKLKCAGGQFTRGTARLQAPSPCIQNSSRLLSRFFPIGCLLGFVFRSHLAQGILARAGAAPSAARSSQQHALP